MLFVAPCRSNQKVWEVASASEAVASPGFSKEISPAVNRTSVQTEARKRNAVLYNSLLSDSS